VENGAVFAAGIGAASGDQAAGKALSQYVTGPVGTWMLESEGMDPG
jgi:hypothetical protein